jgi:hypothetical protein
MRITRPTKPAIPKTTPERTLFWRKEVVCDGLALALGMTEGAFANVIRVVVDLEMSEEKDEEVVVDVVRVDEADELEEVKEADAEVEVDDERLAELEVEADEDDELATGLPGLGVGRGKGIPGSSVESPRNCLLCILFKAWASIKVAVNFKGESQRSVGARRLSLLSS